MNKKLLDILVCPFDKVTSLDLIEFQLTEGLSGNAAKVENLNTSTSGPIRSSPTTTVKSTDKEDNPKPDSTDKELSDIVKEGLLLCKSCSRFYPIMQEIPIILPDELRDRKKDMEFLKRWRESIPSDLLTTLKPWTI